MFEKLTGTFLAQLDNGENASNNWYSLISLIFHLEAASDIQQWAKFLKSDNNKTLEVPNIPAAIKESWIVALNHITDWCTNNDLDNSPLILLNQKPLPYHYSPVNFEFWVSKSINGIGIS